jgi:hypothetical protein
MVEGLRRLLAVAGIVQRAPEVLVLVGADAAEQRGSPPPRCDMWTVRLGWRSNTPELISRIVAITSENSRPTERAVS